MRRFLERGPLFRRPRLLRKDDESHPDPSISTAEVQIPSKPVTQKPESGKTFEGQTDEAYCLECVEGHTMTALTEMRHAIDRHRSAGEMTDGVTEKVRVAIAELQGISEDAKHLQNASPEVKQGLQEILDEVRWIRKEYGVSGRGLTRGQGSMGDLEGLRQRVFVMQTKAYELVEKCPTCKRITKALGARHES